MFTKLTESAETASSKTLDAFAEVICALAPEVCSVSFHDFAADTLLLSEDFLLPEDHQLVEECLVRDQTGGYPIQYGPREGTRYSPSRFRCAMRAARSTARCASPSTRRSRTRARRSRWSIGSRR